MVPAPLCANFSAAAKYAQRGAGTVSNNAAGDERSLKNIEKIFRY